MTTQSQPTSLTTKIKSSSLLLITANISPYLLSLFRWDINPSHYIFLNSIAIALIIHIFSSQSQPDPIQQVFEANRIEINGQYPLLLQSKIKGDELND